MPDNGRREKFHGGRSMLNGPGYHSTAAIVAEVEDSSTWSFPDKDEQEYYGWIQATTTLSISDCSRSIDFDFDWHSQRDRDNSLHKLDIMINLLTRFREGLVIEQARFVERQSKAKPTVE